MESWVLSRLRWCDGLRVHARGPVADEAGVAWFRGFAPDWLPCWRELGLAGSLLVVMVLRGYRRASPP
jgi:hypothetical protein